MPKSPLPLPLTAFEEYMLRDDRPGYRMSIVACLRLTGRLDREAATTAFREVLAQHPLLRATVENRRGRLRWVDCELLPSLQWSDGAADVRLPALPPIDLTKEPGLRAWATSDTTQSSIVFQAHHAACDGKAVLQVAGDFLRNYVSAADGKRDARDLPRCDETLLPRRGTFGLTIWKLLKLLPAQLSGLTGARNFIFRQPVPLLGNLSDISAASRVAEMPPANCMGNLPETSINVRMACLSAPELRRLSATATARDVTVNDWLLRDFFVAMDDFRRRHEATRTKDWLRVSVPLNLRRPIEASMSAANVVSMVFLDRNAAQIAAPAALLQGIHDEIAMVRRRQLGLTFIWSLMALRALPGGMAGRIDKSRCETTCVVSNLGRALVDSPLPRQNGRIVAGNVTLDGIDFFVPIRDGTAASVALVFYAGELQVCLQFDGRRLTAVQAEDLLASYMQTIRASLAGAASRSPSKKRPEPR